MTRTMTPPVPRRPGKWSRSVVLVVVVGAMVVEGLLATLLTPVVAVAVPAALVALVVAIRNPRVVVLVTLGVFLPLAGLLRRFSGSYVSAVDPLTLIAPLIAATCLCVAVGRGEHRPRTPLGGVIAVMVGVGALEVFNPGQGGVVVGVVGAGLFIGPLVWFYVGQLLGNRATLAALVRLLRIVAVGTAVYGMYQLLFGFTAFEDRWITFRSVAYQALFIGGRVRPFSTFASGAEYSYFLALGAVLFFVWKPPFGRAVRMSIVVGMLVACFFAGSRTIFVTGVAIVGVTAVVRRGYSLRVALATSVALSVVGLALLSFLPLASSDSTLANIQNRTLQGLTDPFNSDVSTLGLHITAFREGVVSGFREPLGTGAAVVNSAGKKLGTGNLSADHDLPNVLRAYGLVGGVVLLFLLVRVYKLADRVVRIGRRDLMGPILFALILFGAWFVGELYAISSILWFFVGSVDRQLAEDPADGDTDESEDLTSGDPDVLAGAPDR